MNHWSSLSSSLSSHPWSSVTHGFLPSQKNGLFSSLSAISNQIFPLSQKSRVSQLSTASGSSFIRSSTILGRNRHGKGRGWLDPGEESCPVKITGKISVGRQNMNQILARKEASTSFFFRKKRIWVTGSGHQNFSSCLPERKTLRWILANKFSPNRGEEFLWNHWQHLPENFICAEPFPTLKSHPENSPLLNSSGIRAEKVMNF